LFLEFHNTMRTTCYLPKISCPSAVNLVIANRFALRLSSSTSRRPRFSVPCANGTTNSNIHDDLDKHLAKASTRQTPRKKSLPPTPTQVEAPRLPASSEVWQNAMVLVDKPQGWTSFDLVNKLRFALKVKKVGHAGTLDPMATGLVIIATGRGTKHLDSYMAQEKEYTGTMKLGEATASYDKDSEVVETKPWDHLTGLSISPPPLQSSERERERDRERAHARED